jgi:COMPASS component SWD2
MRQFNYTTSSGESSFFGDSPDGRHSKTLYSKKYGVHLARFTHHSQNVIYASTKEDGMSVVDYIDVDTLRYLSLHDNHYVRYFKGHKKQVVSLEISPVDEQFLSSSLDDTVRLWNMKSPNCQVSLFSS